MERAYDEILAGYHHIHGLRIKLVLLDLLGKQLPYLEVFRRLVVKDIGLAPGNGELNDVCYTFPVSLDEVYIARAEI